MLRSLGQSCSQSSHLILPLLQASPWMSSNHAWKESMHRRKQETKQKATYTAWLCPLAVLFCGGQVDVGGVLLLGLRIGIADLENWWELKSPRIRRKKRPSGYCSGRHPCWRVVVRRQRPLGSSMNATVWHGDGFMYQSCTCRFICPVMALCAIQPHVELYFSYHSLDVVDLAWIASVHGLYVTKPKHTGQLLCII
jgi:hypothetical protein